MAKLGLKNTSKRINKKAASHEKVEKILTAMHEQKIKQMTVRMPDTLHKKMKAKCALDGVPINGFIISLIEDALMNEDRIDIS